MEEAFILLGFSPPGKDFYTIHPDLVERALERISNCGSRLGGGGNLTLIYYLCEQLLARKVLETGVAYGWSTLAILASLSQRSDSLLYSTDKPYPHLRGKGEECVGVAVPESFHGMWHLVRRADDEGLREALDALGTLDLAHHDSDKSYQGRLRAYPRIWSHLRVGGILVCDDVGDNLAFRDFAQSVGVDPVILREQGKHQGLLMKEWP